MVMDKMHARARYVDDGIRHLKRLIDILGDHVLL
jgi:hypothetical protein